MQFPLLDQMLSLWLKLYSFEFKLNLPLGFHVGDWFDDRKLQEDLTDEMVVLARQFKDRSQMITQSVQNIEDVRC